jgi:hypothetical protein
MFAMHRKQFRLGDPSQTIEDHHRIAGCRPQDIGAVMRVSWIQLRDLLCPTCWREIKTMRRHDREIRDSDQRLNDEKELPPAPKELTSSTH